QFLGRVRQPLVQKQRLELIGVDVYVEMPARVDQMLKFVRGRSQRQRLDGGYAVHVIIDGARRIGRQQVEHFRDIARRACLRSCRTDLRKKVPVVEEAADEAG